MTLQIDPEFEALIPPLLECEKASLEASLIQSGRALDPIKVWNGIIIDGHNRFRICTEHGLPFDVDEIELDDRSAVKTWMLQHQASRRSLDRWQLLTLHLTHDREPPKGNTPQEIETAKEAISAGMGPDIIAGRITKQMARNRLAKPKKIGPIATYTKSRRGQTRIIVCPDAHHPFVDERAWNVFLGVLETVRPDILVIIGDFADSYRVSRHVKNPTVRLSVKEEIDLVNKALDQVTKIGIKRVIYCEGNHEKRLQKFVEEKAPELYEIVPDMRALLQIDRRPGWEWVPYHEIVTVGKMNFVHDTSRSGVNALRQTSQDVGDNVSFGHTHRLGVYYGGTNDGVTHVALNVGCLLDFKQVDYMAQFKAHREWQHGFGDITMTKDGVAHCHAVPIVDYKCIIDGVEIAA